MQKFLWSLVKEFSAELALVRKDLSRVSLKMVFAVILLSGSLYLFKIFETNDKTPVKQPQVLAIEQPSFQDAIETTPDPKESPAPVQVGKDPSPVLSAQAAVVIDTDSGKILFEKNAEKQIYPASLTKIMTAVVAMENFNLDEAVTFKTPNNVATFMNLAAGEQITVRNLLYGLLMLSANDVAITLAADHEMNLSTFISKMNKKAEGLGMIHSQFTNPSGLHSPGHFSTAYDLGVLTRYALQNPLFREIVKTRTSVVTDITGTKKHNLYNINKLVQEGYADGVKTGTTPQAGENVIASRVENGHRVIVVVVSSPDRFGEAKKLLQYSFKNYRWPQP